MEDALDLRTAHLALGDGIVGHLLEHLEGMPVLAAILVDRHEARDYRRAPRPDPWAATAPGGGVYTVCPHGELGSGAAGRGLDGGDRVALQAARLRLSVVGDLRGAGVDL